MKIQKSCQVAVVGLGKIGLPLAVQYASQGFPVVGLDISDSVVNSVRAGEPHFPGEPELKERLQAALAADLLSVSTEIESSVALAQVIVIVVPLIVNSESQPDFRILDTASAQVGQGLMRGSLVIYETTLPVGTTRSRLTPILETQSGLSAGKDFEVVFSPERVFSGRIFSDLKRYPKLVGGLTPRGAQAAVDFYSLALDFDSRPDLEEPNGVWDLGSAEAAEFAKLAETTYRDVNIALANEFSKFADSISVDVFQVIRACNSQPFSHIHQPGIAVGGHCIPVYPHLYLMNDPNAQLPRASRAVNKSMPTYAIQKLSGVIGDLRDKVVVVLGMAYRGGVKETAFSGAIDLVNQLKVAGANVFVDDPLYTSTEILALGFEPFQRGTNVDGAILQAEHAEYLTISSDDFPGCRALVDGRNFLGRSQSALNLSFPILTLGRLGL